MVIQFNQPNPYEILGLTPDADRSAITKAFTKKNRGTSQERRQARKAFDSLRRVDERLLIDSFLPLFQEGEQDLSTLIENLLAESEDINWAHVLDLDINLQERLHELTRTIIQELFTEIPPPESTPQLLSDFDDLEEFIISWLK